jgi:hypothetical protein
MALQLVRWAAALMLAKQLQDQLLHYEETLKSRGMQLLCTVSIRHRLVADDYDA